MVRLVLILVCLTSLVMCQQLGGIFYPIPFPQPTVFIRHSLPSASPHLIFHVPPPSPSVVGPSLPLAPILTEQPLAPPPTKNAPVEATKSVMKKQLSGGVTDSVELIKAKLKEKGFNIFATVDHAKNAAGVELELRPTTVIIFGNPNVGTKLMQCAQEYAIDLPQKVLVYEDAVGKVWAVINNQVALADRHGASGCQALVEKVNGKLGKLLGSF